MDEVLTIEEIRTRFAPDWVLIVEPVVDEALRTLAGKVVFHSPSRREVYRKAIELRPVDFAYEYLGEQRTDMEFVL